MDYGICHLNVVPCRLEPSDTSEMVTQILFGECLRTFKESKGSWRRVKTAYDGYTCWIDSKQFLEISPEEFEALQKSNLHVSGGLVELVQQEKAAYPILLGSSLPNLKKQALSFAGRQYTFEGLAVDTSSKLPKENLIENAFMYLDAPYLWGGRSPFGIDCSGLVQLVYKLNGIKLPRDASQQAEKGQTLSFIEEAESGDLAFFDNEEGEIIHVGIILEDNKIIHASGKVRVDRIDHQGIFNTSTRKYSHRLRLIKRIIK